MRKVCDCNVAISYFQSYICGNSAMEQRARQEFLYDLYHKLRHKRINKKDCQN